MENRVFRENNLDFIFLQNRPALPAGHTELPVVLFAGAEVRDVPGQSPGSFPDQEGSDQSEDRPFLLLAPEVRTGVVGYHVWTISSPGWWTSH